MQTDATRQHLLEFYQALGLGDRDRLWRCLSERIDWTVNCPPHIFRFSGWRQGRESVFEALRQFRREYGVEDFRQEVMIVEGDRGAVISDALVRQRTSGRKIRISLVDFTRFEAGLLVEYRQFLNSFDFVEQALGRELYVGQESV